MQRAIYHKTENWWCIFTPWRWCGSEGYKRGLVLCDTTSLYGEYVKQPPMLFRTRKEAREFCHKLNCTVAESGRVSPILVQDRYIVRQAHLMTFKPLGKCK